MGNAYELIADGRLGVGSLLQRAAAVAGRRTAPSGFQYLQRHMYVLPDGVNFTLQDPPTISSATQNPNGTVTVSGKQFRGRKQRLLRWSASSGNVQ